MRFETLFISTLLLVTSVTVWCQDKIYKRDGSTISVIVKEVGTKNVTYKKYDNPDGPLYTVQNSEIEKIVYQNGSEDTFDSADDTHRPTFAERRAEAEERGRHKKKISYDRNVIAIAPLQVSDQGVGLGLSYERILDKSGIVSFYLPAYITFSTNSSNTYNPSTGTYSNNASNDPLFYIAPGIKVYPTGNQGKVKYSVGPSFVVASGSQSNYDYNGNSVSQSKFMAGVMVINGLNVNPSPKIFLGLEMGVGVTYINRINGVLSEAQGLFDFSFRIGYRFK